VIRTFILGFSLLAFLSACEKKHEISKEYPAEVTAIATEGGRGLPYFVGKDLRPVWQLKDASEPRSLMPFDLKDQNGQQVDAAALKGKIGIVAFFYSECPGICPMTTRNLQAIQEKFKNDDRIMMVSFSVTPEKDTPEKLKNYAMKNHISYDRWRLLTGNKTQIYKIARESFNADTFSEKENAVQKLRPEDFLHSENVYLIDGEQKLRGIYQGQQVSSLDELARDAEVLLR
jgi:protein SCO1/2